MDDIGRGEDVAGSSVAILEAVYLAVGVVLREIACVAVNSGETTCGGRVGHGKSHRESLGAGKNEFLALELESAKHVDSHACLDRVGVLDEGSIATFIVDLDAFDVAVDTEKREDSVAVPVSGKVVREDDARRGGHGCLVRSTAHVTNHAAATRGAAGGIDVDVGVIRGKGSVVRGDVVAVLVVVVLVVVVGMLLLHVHVHVVVAVRAVRVSGVAVVRLSVHEAYIVLLLLLLRVVAMSRRGGRGARGGGGRSSAVEDGGLLLGT